MKPFTAWLAMNRGDRPMRYPAAGQSRSYGLFADKRPAIGAVPPQPVLIVADTPENRKKLGMEE